MKIYLFLAFIFVFVFTLFSDNISLGADVWLPYNGDPNEQHVGYMIEIAKTIFEKEGHTIDYQIMPWSRAIKDARSGTVNAIVGALKDEAPDFIYPKNEQGLSVPATFFVKKGDSWKFKEITSLKNKNIGIINDYSYGSIIDDFLKDKNNQSIIQSLSGTDALEQNIKKLLFGRIDIVIEDKIVMAYKLKSMNIQDQIIEAGNSGEKTLLYIAFSPVNKNSKKYAEILSKGMDNLRNNGELKKILDVYGLKDWK